MDVGEEPNADPSFADTHCAENSPRSLFVYGTFSEGMVHFSKIAAYAVEQRAAGVRGTLYRLPSGLIAMSAGGAQMISGHVVTLQKAEILLSLLDQFHGVHYADPEQSLFFRSPVAALFENGLVETTNVYSLNPSKQMRGAVELRHADWRSDLTAYPPLFARLTDRQKLYIRKLGVCSGREIVPIDLNLYRELMHLEIVVDKGRRLALSPLGQELFRLL